MCSYELDSKSDLILLTIAVDFERNMQLYTCKDAHPSAVQHKARLLC